MVSDRSKYGDDTRFWNVYGKIISKKDNIFSVHGHSVHEVMLGRSLNK